MLFAVGMKGQNEDTQANVSTQGTLWCSLELLIGGCWMRLCAGNQVFGMSSFYAFNFWCRTLRNPKILNSSVAYLIVIKYIFQGSSKVHILFNNMLA